MASDLRPPLAPLFDALGTAATVTVPGDPPVATTVIVVGPASDEGPAVERVHQALTRIALRRADVPSAPPGTTIQTGSTTRTVTGAPVAEDDEVIEVRAY